MGKALKRAGIGCLGLLGLLIVLVVIIALASGGGATSPKVSTCKDLAPHIIELSEERESPFSGRVLKFYDIVELETSDDYILKCRARATRSRGGDANIIFYMTEDEDGDRFIGMEVE